MSTEVMTLPSTDAAPTQKQTAAWVNMAQEKNILVKKLTLMELEAQAALAHFLLSQSYAEIDAAVAKYRKHNIEMGLIRKEYTDKIDDGIVKPLMEFEKRVKDAPAYASLIARSLTLRKDERDKAIKVTAKNQEIARFKAHIENEFHRVATDYRLILRKEIAGQYAIALREKLSGKTEDIKKMMATIAAPQVAKFQTTVLTEEDKKAVVTQHVKEKGLPDFHEMYKDGCKLLDETFANFDSDVANAEAAIQHNAEQEQLNAMQEQKAHDEATAINTLIATAETVIIAEPKIKKTVSVAVEESWAWMQSVMAAFLANRRHMEKYIRVKKVSNLTIGQMATALGQLATETTTTFTGLTLNEVEK
jgi:hypothetical protein